VVDSVKRLGRCSGGTITSPVAWRSRPFLSVIVWAGSTVGRPTRECRGVLQFIENQVPRISFSLGDDQYFSAESYLSYCEFPNQTQSCSPKSHSLRRVSISPSSWKPVKSLTRFNMSIIAVCCAEWLIYLAARRSPEMRIGSQLSGESVERAIPAIHCACHIADVEYRDTATSLTSLGLCISRRRQVS
jgi:hypothetical protein